MKSALLAILGVSLLATTVGCDGGSDDGGGTAGTGAGPVMSGGTPGAGGTGVVPSAGTGTTAGTTATGGTGTGGTGTPASGVPLTVMDGWVDGANNLLKIQGAMFSYADDTSAAGPPAMTTMAVGEKVCISGVAAKVDLMCTKPAGMDCYGLYWGAAIGLNLNQPNVDDPANPGMMIGGDPMAYDASAITGFAFTIDGTKVPTSLRFKVESGTPDAPVEYCTPTAKAVKLGENSYLFSDLLTECWKTGGMPATGAKNALYKIAWQVVTNDKATVPFDYCVSNVRALQ
ncbi:MAG: hypothetical protein EOO73_15380 [Myxococcales bacterium]|nr:MAG: hypothetical protein EOO73_15380 [Myxococcales bacterium]